MLITTKEIPITTFANYKRLFTYGCSMTGHDWPTWADILGQEIPLYQNYGLPGSGNQLISTRFVQSIVTENLNNNDFHSNDMILIMFSTTWREDRYINNHWRVNGNLANAQHSKYYKMWKENKEWFNESHCRYRDLIYMYSIKEMLINRDCLSYLCTMSDELQDQYKLSDEIEKLTQYILPFLGYDMLNKGCNGHFPKYSHMPSEYHPSPAQHFTFLKNLFPNITWKKNTENFVKFWEKRVQTNSIKIIQKKWSEFKHANSTKYPIG
jgi:hypothetical protein|tara:strand:+ start:469 stop:1269 length:801 start_codon:yes stop_codon:yes gene_type:complete